MSWLPLVLPGACFLGCFSPFCFFGGEKLLCWFVAATGIVGGDFNPCCCSSVLFYSFLVLWLLNSPSSPRLFFHARMHALQAAGIETGDTLQKLDGVALGSYKEGMEMFKKQSGSIVITVLRQDDITI